VVRLITLQQKYFGNKLVLAEYMFLIKVVVPAITDTVGGQLDALLPM
jgi:hypothetical protein